ncbi:hypothetical protein [Saccharolobus shibatae]|uniref:Uncharacterized protein n=1 Tax=Saccharolobus shibatae TaxID=2286 RepID=A0A8F5GUX1_9CREN|nr:hypothetical protein [Saccharolobus shibatae]QXJ30332.1 hypothetical protein J5U21_p0074 [Saccharolobus shibatae]QXJ30434.1 hypothetical protein J5U21_00074 [Saccharolobus shibatae]
MCTVGLNENLEWRRIYPIPADIFFRGDYSNLRFKKWDIIEVDLTDARPKDPRTESYKVVNWKDIKIIGHIERWEDRIGLLEKVLDKDIESIWNSNRSIGVIKPVQLIDFYVKQRNRIKEEAEMEVLNKMDEAQATLEQYINIRSLRDEILPDVKEEKEIKIEQLPWIGYKFKCANINCKAHEMMAIDWEIQELFRKYNQLDPVKKKVFYEFKNRRNLYFVIGNTWRFRKSFMIISVVYPPTGTRANLNVSFDKFISKQNYGIDRWL